MEDWPPGARFVLGFGQTMMKNMLQYIEDNKDMLLEETNSGQESAVG
jgi:hypothetical protein